MDIRTASDAYSRRRAEFKTEATSKENNKAVREAYATALTAHELAAATFADLAAALHLRVLAVSASTNAANLSVDPAEITTDVRSSHLPDKLESSLLAMRFNLESMRLRGIAISYRIRDITMDSLASIQDNATDSWYLLSNAHDEATLKNVIVAVIKTVFVDAVDVSKVLALTEAVLDAISRRRKQRQGANKLLNDLDAYVEHAIWWSVVVQETMDVLSGEPVGATYERAFARTNDRLRALAAGSWKMPTPP